MGIDLSLTHTNEIKQNYFKKSFSIILRFVLVWLLIHIGFLVNFLSTTQKFNQIKKKQDIYLAIEKEVLELKKEINSLSEDVKILESFSPQKFHWSEKLLIFAKLIPEHIWLEKLSIQKTDKSSIIKLKGFLYSQDPFADKLSLLNTFIKQLKDEPSFFDIVEDIILVDAKLVDGIRANPTLKSIEILEFNLEIPTK